MLGVIRLGHIAIWDSSLRTEEYASPWRMLSWHSDPDPSSLEALARGFGFYQAHGEMDEICGSSRVQGTAFARVQSLSPPELRMQGAHGSITCRDAAVRDTPGPRAPPGRSMKWEHRRAETPGG